MKGLRLAVRVESWPIRGGFTISRGAKHEAVVVVAELSDGSHRGRGECVPYARYGESVEGVVAAIEACTAQIGRGLSRAELARCSPPAPRATRLIAPCGIWKPSEAAKAPQVLPGLPLCVP